MAQDEKSSAIYGMNKLAVERGYVDQVAPLDELAKTMLAQLGR
ncbi:MAG: chemotaxis protein CheB [Candidatus Omnitrophota bacterium]